jgi:hypothetical protein
VFASLAVMRSHANPFQITPDMLRPGMVQTGATTFQPVNCVKLSQVLPDAPAALSDSYVCTASQPPRTAVVQ